MGCGVSNSWVQNVLDFITKIIIIKRNICPLSGSLNLQNLNLFNLIFLKKYYFRIFDWDRQYFFYSVWIVSSLFLKLCPIFVGQVLSIFKIQKNQLFGINKQIIDYNICGRIFTSLMKTWYCTSMLELLPTRMGTTIACSGVAAE